MVLETMDDLLIDQLRDLYSAEIQLEVALPVIIDGMSSPLVRAAFEQRFEETEHQILRLQEIFSTLGSTPRGPRKSRRRESDGPPMRGERGSGGCARSRAGTPPASPP